MKIIFTIVSSLGILFFGSALFLTDAKPQSSPAPSQTVSPTNPPMNPCPGKAVCQGDSDYEGKNFIICCDLKLDYCTHASDGQPVCRKKEDVDHCTGTLCKETQGGDYSVCCSRWEICTHNGDTGEPGCSRACKDPYVTCVGQGNWADNFACCGDAYPKCARLPSGRPICRK
jgi:hypothetical protein